jgi:hypothetical protein
MTVKLLMMIKLLLWVKKKVLIRMMKILKMRIMKILKMMDTVKLISFKSMRDRIAIEYNAIQIQEDDEEEDVPFDFEYVADEEV